MPMSEKKHISHKYDYMCLMYIYIYFFFLYVCLSVLGLLELLEAIVQDLLVLYIISTFHIACCPSSGDLTIHQWAACWDHCPCRTNLCVYHSISTLVYIHLYPDICLYTIWHRMYFFRDLEKNDIPKLGKKTWTAKSRLAVSETRFWPCQIKDSSLRNVPHRSFYLESFETWLSNDSPNWSKLDMMWEWRAMANFKNFQLQIQILVTGRVCKWQATWVLALCMACRSLMLCTWARGLNLEISWGLMGARPPLYRLEPHKVPMYCWLKV